MPYDTRTTETESAYQSKAMSFAEQFKGMVCTPEFEYYESPAV
jgi:hypothetical protein